MIETYRRVFVALDGKNMEAVARKGVRLARMEGAELCLGHVVDSLGREATAADLDALANTVRARLETQLAEVLKEAREAPEIPSVEVRVAAGPVVATLMNGLIAHFQPDAVVCGRRDIPDMKRLMLGSVSAHLVKGLSCDVLIARA